MSFLEFLLPLTLILTLIAFVIWGNLPAKKPAEDEQTFQSTKDHPRGIESSVGLMTGMSGGDLGDAAVSNYALGRLQAETGRPPTAYEIGLAVGLAQTIEPPNMFGDASDHTL